MTEIAPGIITDDGAGLASFYCRGLRFEITDLFEFPQGDVRRLRRDSVSLKLFQPARATKPSGRGDDWQEQRGHAYVALYVEDAASEVQAAVGAGATLLVPVTEHRPGARFALISDPEGNVWEILQET